ncbi:MAG: MFS transporter [Pirellula sp.]|nr:MFS transporter [Pirellula sp.]
MSAPSDPTYRTSPELRSDMPPGIPYIVGNEAAERFSFYGMKAILVVFMTEYLRNSQGELAPMGKIEANKYFHLFESSAYAFPVLGALLADALWGKYRTIIVLSIVYCFGHFALAVDETRLGLLLGLTLIAIGTGGIKPCVSAHVGDQFSEQNKHLIERVFGWFYFSINFGSFFSTLLIPAILGRRGVFEQISPEHAPAYAFGVPGVLMFIATIVFWRGRNKYAHIPPGGAKFIDETFGPDGLKTVLRLAPLYFFVLFFWALYDQTGSAWVQQAKELNCNILGMDLLPAQIQAVNPLLIMIYIPLFSFVIYPAMGKYFTLTPLRKIGIGMALTAAAFGISWFIEGLIAATPEGSPAPSAWWQVLAYVVITAGEVMVSITSLEYSYTQAPNRMKSLVMSCYLLTVSLGNVLTAGFNSLIENEDGSSRIEGTTYYAFFTMLMVSVTLAYAFASRSFREQTYIQGSEATH